MDSMKDLISSTQMNEIVAVAVKVSEFKPKTVDN
jgi:hypothetical protein